VIDDLDDLDEWRMKDANIPTTTLPNDTRRKRDEAFVMLPLTWMRKLRQAPGSTWELAILLHHRRWRRRGVPFELGNQSIGEFGISRYAKYRALKNLERLQLIQFRRKGAGASFIIEWMAD
jgi:hypothetical protein